MTDKILSQDEVDALLKGVASGEIDTEDAKEQLMDGARVYDFTSQERLRWPMKVLPDCSERPYPT